MADANLNALCKGFSKLNKTDRFKRLVQMGILTETEVAQLTQKEQLPTDLAEKFIENVIGYFQLPLGIATNFRIDNKDYVIPMAVEETSIIAAASKNARWVRDHGEITTEVLGHLSIGQIQIAKIKDYAKLEKIIHDKKSDLMEIVNDQVAYGLVARGGGVKDIELRKVDRGDSQFIAVIHILVDTCDAMGANTITQICEYLKTPIEKLANETVTMCILSNLNDKKLTRAKATIYNIDPELGEKIAEASLFAKQDPYRAATHNKGTLNGIDPVLIATGNDWRAVEAGIHAYACRDGQYRAITEWQMCGAHLVGTFEAPLVVGIVGGVTRLHPTAQVCLKMLQVTTADELSRIVAAVGLIQNLGAIHALTTFGFIEGHLKLHISNLTLNTDAEKVEIPILEGRLRKILAETKKVTVSQAKEILNQIRAEKIAAKM